MYFITPNEANPNCFVRLAVRLTAFEKSVQNSKLLKKLKNEKQDKQSENMVISHLSAKCGIDSLVSTENTGFTDLQRANGRRRNAQSSRVKTKRRQYGVFKVLLSLGTLVGMQLYSGHSSCHKEEPGSIYCTRKISDCD